MTNPDDPKDLPPDVTPPDGQPPSKTDINIYLRADSSPEEEPLEDLLKGLSDDLPSLPPRLHLFRDPRHGGLLSEIEEKRAIVLTSYQESAAYAAAFSIVNDDHFRRQEKRAFSLTRKKDRDRSDLDLVALTDEYFLGKKPQILLIEIDGSCILLDTALSLNWVNAAKIRDRLEKHSSYLILVIDEDLLRGDTTARIKPSLPYFNVSHLGYLLTRVFSERAADLEKRFLASVKPGNMDLRELYQRIADRLQEGADAVEAFLCELEQVRDLPAAVQKERLQPVHVEEVFREGSEIHKAASFVATYIPDLGQRDFDRFVRLLLGEETATNGGTRRLGLVEPLESHWSDRWRRNTDQVFRECHLRTAVSSNGAWCIDFGEPYLRRELRMHMERHSPWYVRRQCQMLQDSGVIFAMDLSPVAVEGLVRLFVDWAIVDPVGFGSTWLLGLVLGLQIQHDGEPPGASSEERLAWLFDKLSADVQLRKLFHERLALLVREMLEREALRPMVREFFEFLLVTRKHAALLDVVLELAERLRFAPHFDALYWMKRLLNQGIEGVKERAAASLIKLARRSGPRIYEFLASIRGWLPEAGRSSGSFSDSNRIAINFPFDYCLAVAKSLPPQLFGAWPSRHPLFYALPSDPNDARVEIGRLIEWILDPRGAALETADRNETMRTAEVVRIEGVADLLEHWAWVLEGDTESGAEEGRALFAVILEEFGERLGEKERLWLLRSWQKRREAYLNQAAGGHGYRDARHSSLVARRAKLDRLRERIAAQPASRGANESAENERGTAS